MLMTSPHETNLLRRLRAGERDAFEVVVARHYASVYRQLWHLCGDRDTAADLTQETFVQAWLSLHAFAGRSTLRTWLHTIAVRVWHRSHAGDSHALRALLVPLDAMTSRGERSEPTVAADARCGPAAQMEARALWDAIDDALRDLPPAYREAVRLYCMEEMRYREIADTLAIPVGTVKSRLHEGLRRLRARLLTTEFVEPEKDKRTL